MSPKIERLDVETSILGEGPHWDADTQSLYYVDIYGGTINKYRPSTKKHTKVYIVKGRNDEFVVTIGREILLIQWDGEGDKFTIRKKLYEGEEDSDNVFNDGKCDPSGRLWAGTVGVVPKDNKSPRKKGNLYSFKNGIATKHLSQINLSNGLAFDTDSNKFYYIDSMKGALDEYDFDIAKGTISNGQPIFKLFEEYTIDMNLEVMDGMAIDTDGNLWVAIFNVGKVIKVDPRKPGVIADSIAIPVKQVTSVAFGGPNLDELYVTTGRFTVKGYTPTDPEYGSLYRVTGLNAKGFPGDGMVL